MIYYDLSAHPDIIQYHYEALKVNVLKKVDGSSLSTPQKQFIKIHLYNILTGTPDVLLKLQKEYDAIKNKKNASNEVLKKIINYESFSSKSRSYCAYVLAEKLSIRTCLYCNRQYTLTIIKNKDQITRPEFDHFFSQSKHRLLALSIFNLIPSCHICNSTLKGITEFNLSKNFHPYVHDLTNHYKYTFVPYEVASVLGSNSKLKIKIEVEVGANPESSRISNSKDVFKLEEIFNGHTEEVKDLFDVRYKLSEKYLDQLSHTYRNLNISKEEMYRFAFGVYYEEVNFIKRPFSKLKSDLLKELGIIDNSIIIG